MNNPENNEKTVQEQEHEQLEEIIKGPFTSIRYHEEFAVYEIIGDVKQENVQASISDTFDIWHIFEDEEFAQEISSGQDYEIHSDEYFVWMSFVNPDIEIEPFIPGFLKHRRDIIEHGEYGPFSSPHCCACGKQFSHEDRLFKHVLGKKDIWREKQEWEK